MAKNQIPANPEFQQQYPYFYGEVWELLMDLESRCARDAELALDVTTPLSTRLHLAITSAALRADIERLRNILQRYPDPYNPGAHDRPRPSKRELKLIAGRDRTGD